MYVSVLKQAHTYKLTNISFKHAVNSCTYWCIHPLLLNCSEISWVFWYFPAHSHWCSVVKFSFTWEKKCPCRNVATSSNSLTDSEAESKTTNKTDFLVFSSCNINILRYEIIYKLNVDCLCRSEEINHLSGLFTILTFELASRTEQPFICVIWFTLSCQADINLTEVNSFTKLSDKVMWCDDMSETLSFFLIILLQLMILKTWNICLKRLEIFFFIKLQP